MITEGFPCGETFSRLHQDPHLHHAAYALVFGLTQNRELTRHGLDMSTGTVHPILHQIEPAGSISRAKTASYRGRCVSIIGSPPWAGGSWQEHA